MHAGNELQIGKPTKTREPPFFRIPFPGHFGPFLAFFKIWRHLYTALFECSSKRGGLANDPVLFWPTHHQSTSGKRGTKIHLKAASQKGTRIAKSSIKQGVPGAFAGNCLPGGYPKIIGQKLPYMGTWFMSLMWLAFAIALASPLTFFWPLYSLRDRFLEHLLALSRPG
jgi:hypothetical protein